MRLRDLGGKVGRSFSRSFPFIPCAVRRGVALRNQRLWKGLRLRPLIVACGVAHVVARSLPSPELGVVPRTVRGRSECDDSGALRLRRVGESPANLLSFLGDAAVRPVPYLEVRGSSPPAPASTRFSTVSGPLRRRFSSATRRRLSGRRFALDGRRHLLDYLSPCERCQRCSFMGRPTVKSGPPSLNFVPPNDPPFRRDSQLLS